MKKILFVLFMMSFAVIAQGQDLIYIYTDSSEVSFWELIVIFLITFCITTSLQRMIVKNEFKKDSEKFLIILFIIFFASFLIYSIMIDESTVISGTLSIAAITILIALYFDPQREQSKKARNWALITSQFLFILLVSTFWYPIEILLAEIAGVLFGLPTIYIWRFFTKSKKAFIESC